MIVTTGRIIKVQTGLTDAFYFERSSETPGLVTVAGRRQGVEFELPGNEHDAEQFIAAYRRTIQEDVGYRKSEVE